MPISIVKDTIELESITTDASGNAYITKRVNLTEGSRHTLLQVDTFVDAFPSANMNCEVVVSPYPAIPTDMDYETVVPRTNRYPAAGTDSILYKERLFLYRDSSEILQKQQFPSEQIASRNVSYFYTDHVFVNFSIRADPNTLYSNIAYSFMLVLMEKNVNYLEHALGVISEQHDAMCALVMSNGHMRSRQALEGNVFPIWRYGGIRPEHTITPTAANSFFLDIASRDAEDMQNPTQIRQAVADARQMSAYDAALGLRRPDWLREFLNAGIEAGEVRPNPVPLRYADNGNTRMF